MPEWRIYYADGSVVRGRTTDAWRAAPDEGVQVVVLMAPGDRRPWRGVEDRHLWTGTDDYDPFGWGRKTGSLIADAAYQAIWERACGDD